MIVLLAQAIVFFVGPVAVALSFMFNIGAWTAVVVMAALPPFILLLAPVIGLWGALRGMGALALSVLPAAFAAGCWTLKDIDLIPDGLFFPLSPLVLTILVWVSVKGWRLSSSPILRNTIAFSVPIVVGLTLFAGIAPFSRMGYTLLDEDFFYVEPHGDPNLKPSGPDMETARLLEQDGKPFTGLAPCYGSRLRINLLPQPITGLVAYDDGYLLGSSGDIGLRFYPVATPPTTKRNLTAAYTGYTSFIKTEASRWGPAIVLPGDRCQPPMNRTGVMAVSLGRDGEPHKRMITLAPSGVIEKIMPYSLTEDGWNRSGGREVYFDGLGFPYSIQVVDEHGDGERESSPSWRADAFALLEETPNPLGDLSSIAANVRVELTEVPELPTGTTAIEWVYLKAGGANDFSDGTSWRIFDPATSLSVELSHQAWQRVNDLLDQALLVSSWTENPESALNQNPTFTLEIGQQRDRRVVMHWHDHRLYLANGRIALSLNREDGRNEQQREALARGAQALEDLLQNLQHRPTNVNSN